jgi:hypothetical protein
VDTIELREVLSVLRRLTDLAPTQADLLHQVCAGPLSTAEDLTLAGVLPVPDSRRLLTSGAPAADRRAACLHTSPHLDTATTGNAPPRELKPHFICE